MEEPLNNIHENDGLQKAAIYASDISRALGSSQFPSDIYTEDCLVGVVVRSPFAHCIYKKIDVSRALALPGVQSVVTADDIPGEKFVGKLINDTPVIVQEGHKACSMLDAICLIAADNEDIARRAAKLIDIEVELLEEVFTVEDALKPEAPQIHQDGNIATEVKIRHGNIEDGFAEADVIIENSYRLPSIDHAFMETEAAFAEPLENGLRIFVGSQNPYLERELAAGVLDLPEDKVVIIDVHAGGGFGRQG